MPSWPDSATAWLARACSRPLNSADRMSLSTTVAWAIARMLGPSIPRETLERRRIAGFRFLRVIADPEQETDIHRVIQRADVAALEPERDPVETGDRYYWRSEQHTVPECEGDPRPENAVAIADVLVAAAGEDRLHG